MKRLSVVIIFLLIFFIKIATTILYAGGGKACPFCSGTTYTLQEGILLQESGTQTGPLLFTKKFFFSSVYAPDIPAKGISYFRYGLTNRLELGVGYAWGNGKILGSASYLLNRESNFLPSLILGIGAARIDILDTSINVAVSKELQRIIKTRLRIYLGLSKPISDEEIIFIGGLIKPISNFLVSSLQYFGEDELHLALYTNIKSVTIGLMVLHLFDTNDAGIYLGFGL